MKRYAIAALALVLCCGLFTGCRRGNAMKETITPTNEATAEMPTIPATMPVTRPATEPVTQAPTERETHETTGGMTEATENGSAGATEGSRSRGVPRRPAAR